MSMCSVASIALLRCLRIISACVKFNDFGSIGSVSHSISVVILAQEDPDPLRLGRCGGRCSSGVAVAAAAMFGAINAGRYGGSLGGDSSSISGLNAAACVATI
eukprot:11429237-Heterocapsa_arctica.AAC.1